MSWLTITKSAQSIRSTKSITTTCGKHNVDLMAFDQVMYSYLYCFEWTCQGNMLCVCAVFLILTADYMLPPLQCLHANGCLISSHLRCIFAAALIAR